MWLDGTRIAAGEAGGFPRAHTCPASGDAAHLRGEAEAGSQGRRAFTGPAYPESLQDGVAAAGSMLLCHARSPHPGIRGHRVTKKVSYCLHSIKYAIACKYKSMRSLT
jgi:hypothetical protein